MIVADYTPITLVGGGQVSASALSEALRYAPKLIAADGGAATCLQFGRKPDRVIGDLDSLAPDLRRELEDRIEHVPTQVNSDFEKCLDRLEAPVILALGFTGGRLDHTMAAIAAVVGRRAQSVILVSPEDISVLICDSALSLPLPAGARLSLIPMPDCRVDLAGVRWPLAETDMDFTKGQVSLSNEAGANIVTITTRGAALLCLELAYLPIAIGVAQGEHRAG